MDIYSSIRRSPLEENEILPGVFSTMSCSSYSIAVVNWTNDDGIAKVICKELVNLGHRVTCFRFDQPIPPEAEVVFSFAPYGRFLQIPAQLEKLPRHKRPVFIHWNTENPPDPRVPWMITRLISSCRSWIDRLNDSDKGWLRSLVNNPPLAWAQRRMHKFRYVGDYHYAYQKGWIDLFVESSEIYAQYHNQHGLPTMVAPWGTAPGWYDDLNLNRDIDVLWFGTRRTRRRSKLLDQVRSQLAAHGVQMYVADNVENPFIYNDERTQILNRAKITLNLLPTWYDNAFPYRFHIAAGNGSLVVSEPILPHCAKYRAGQHYVSTPVERLTETILYYLAHEQERLQITNNAYELVTTEMTFENSVKIIMNAVHGARQPTGQRVC